MCQKLNCYISPCTCCSNCNCDLSCYDCYDVKHQRLSMTARSEHSSADVRHKFVCFPCRRVWKSYTNKYLVRKSCEHNVDFSLYVPNICKPTMNKQEKLNAEEKYRRAYGYTGFSSNFNYEGASKPKCAKCGENAVSVGRNFRHCRNEKHWKDIEEKSKNGAIDLLVDFRNYPKKEGLQNYTIRHNKLNA